MVELTRAEYQILRSATQNAIDLQDECNHSELKSILHSVQEYNPTPKRQELRWYYGSLIDKLEQILNQRDGPYRFELSEF